MNTTKDDSPAAVAGQVDCRVRPAVAVAHGSDEHLTLLGAPWHWNLLHGVDRADMLGFGRACMEVERERWAAPVRALLAAHDAALMHVGEMMRAQGLTTMRIGVEAQAELKAIEALRGLVGPNVELTCAGTASS